MNKAQLRLCSLNKRESLDSEYIRVSGISICNSLTDSLIYRQADLILCYVPMKSEVNTLPLIINALAIGKTVAVPYCRSKEMTFRVISSLDDLTQGTFGTLTAVDSCETVRVFENCLCIVPALTCDRECNRIGYGGGYYDRFLSVNNNIRTVCLCYEKCILESVPVNKHDIKVDTVLTEKHIYGGALNA